MTIQRLPSRARGGLGVALLGLALAVAAATSAGAAGFAESRRWELGLGFHGGWAHLEEAAPDGFALSEEPGYGLVLAAGRRLAPRATATLTVLAARHDTNQEDVSADWSAALLGLRYELVRAGGLAPYLHGGLGGVKTRIRSEAPGGGGPGGGRARREELELNGLAGLLGAGLRLAASPRLLFDLEVDQLIVGYNDESVVLESGYTGTRIDKAGSFTRLAVVAYLLL
jgi:hypothetical protein